MAGIEQQLEPLQRSAFEMYPRMSPGAVLEVTASLNTTISCSEHESLHLWSRRGWRWDMSCCETTPVGSEEQLVDGVNGSATTEIAPPVRIEDRASAEQRGRSSDHALQAMDAASRQLVAPYLKSSYLAELKSI